MYPSQNPGISTSILAHSRPKAGNLFHKLLFAVITLIGCTFPLRAADYFSYSYEGQTLNYITLSDSTCAVDRGNHCSGEVIIPSSVTYNDKEYTVVEISYAAFSSINITSVTIPNTITKICMNAFYSCKKLASIEIPGSVTEIGTGAFGSCHELTSVTIPSSVVVIGRAPFNNCIRLESINVESGNPEFSSEGGVLFNKDYTHLIQFPGGWKSDYDIPNSVTTICESAFEYCKPSSVTIPNSVVEIGDQAFMYSYLSAINIPNSVKVIGKNAFWNCSMTSVAIPSSVEEIGEDAFGDCYNLNSFIVDPENKYFASYDGVLFSKDYCFLRQYPCGKTDRDYTIPDFVTEIGPGAFTWCYLNSVAIPNSVILIGSGAFLHCEYLSDVTIGNSVTTIGSSAFSYCRSLNSINIPNSVSTIDDGAFSVCSGLTSIVIPNSVTTIGSGSFAYCDNLMEATIGNSVTKMGSEIFRECNMLETVYFNAERCTDFGGISNPSVFPETLREVIFGDKVQLIPDYALKNCKCLTSVTIPSSVTEIGMEAFEGCENLETVYFNAENCTNCGDSYLGPAFPSNLKYVYIGDNVKSIPGEAFSGLSGLTSVTIGNSVNTIGDFAFWDCSGLTSLTIPSSVTKIGSGAFGYCTGLESVKIMDIDKWTQIYFYSDWSNPIYFAKSFTIGDSDEPVKYLDLDLNEGGVSAYAFCNAENLETVRVKGSKIGKSAFAGCSNLKQLCIDVDELSEYSFSGNDNMEAVYCTREVPPTAFDNSFSKYEGVKLYVPEGSVSRYATAEKCWYLFLDDNESNFSDLEDIFGPGGMTEIKDVVGDYTDAPVEVYDLNGVKVGDSTESLQSGFYIVRQGNDVKKIAVK